MTTHHSMSRRSSGFTLVEAVISIVIVGVMFVAALTTVATAAKGRLIQAEWRRADTLGRSLLAEVAQAPYGSTSGGVVSSALQALGNLGAGADRAGWSSLDDFHGLVDSPPCNRRGVALSDYAGKWSRKVVIERVDPSNPDGASTGSSDYGLKRITVTVTAPSGKPTVLTTLRSRWSWTEADVSPDFIRAQAAVITLEPTAGGRVHAGALLPGGVMVANTGGVVESQAEATEATGGLLSGILGALLGGGK